jgi:ribosomal protein S17E
VRFQVVGESVKIAEVHVNRDPAQQLNTDHERDASLLGILLDSRAKRDVRNQILGYIKGESSN